MTVREYLEHIQTPNCDEISVTGDYTYGLVDLYKGKVQPLLDLLHMNDILERKNWGGMDKDKCFLLMDVNVISGNWINVKMPKSYKHENKNGEILDCYL